MIKTNQELIIGIKEALKDLQDNSLNVSTCDYYSWNRKWEHIDDLLEHI